MPSIVCTGPVPDVVTERLARYGTVVIAPDDSEEGLCRLVGDAVAIVARASARITARVIAEAPLLRVIGRSGAGIDNVDLTAASQRSIPVVFTPDAGTDAVAEGAFALLLALVKRLPELDEAVRAGQWSARDTIPVRDLAGATLGIVGLGRIGRRVAELSEPFHLRRIGHDPYLPACVAGSLGVSSVDLETLFAEADLITVHAQLTPDSAGLIDQRLLGLCGPGAILVNTSRGGLIRSLDDIYHALQNGRLAGVGFDVLPEEPPRLAHPLFSDRRVLFTPHALGLSVAARRRTFDAMGAGMIAVLRGDRPENVANPEIYSRTGRQAPAARTSMQADSGRDLEMEDRLLTERRKLQGTPGNPAREDA